MDSVASDTLKNLYIYRNGENKGFIKLLEKQELDKTYEDRFKEFMKHAIDGANDDLMELCMLIDVDLKDIEPLDFEIGDRYV